MSAANLTDIADRLHSAVANRMEVARYWVRNVGRIQPPIELIWLAARAELNRNPTITAYKYVDGKEIRRRSDPWARFRASLENFANALQSVGLLGTRPELPWVVYRDPDTNAVSDG